MSVHKSSFKNKAASRPVLRSELISEEVTESRLPKSGLLLTMNSRDCDHGFALILSFIDDDPGSLVCAPCVMEHCIAEIRETQAGLKRRGGIFQSKTRPYHGISAKNWRRAKVKCSKAITTLAKLQDECPIEAEQCGVVEALKIWEEARDECCVVPGFGYTTDEVERQTENVAEATSSIVSDREAVQNIENAEMVDSETAGMELMIYHGRQDQPLSSLPCRKATDSENLNDTAAREMVVLVSRLCNLETSTVDHSEVVAEDAKELTDNIPPNKAVGKPITSIESTIRNDTIATTTALSATNATLSEHSPSTPRPALKRTTLSPPRTPRHITFDNQVTILPHQSPPQTLTKTPHNDHTTAERSHHRLSLRRSSRLYKPSVWASPEGSEKLNTSFQTTTWDVYERLQRPGSCDTTYRSDQSSYPVYESEYRETLAATSTPIDIVSRGSASQSSRVYGTSTPSSEFASSELGSSHTPQQRLMMAAWAQQVKDEMEDRWVQPESER